MSYRVALASISLLLGCVSVQSAEAGEDVMLRSEEQWETMESIHRHAVDVRLREVVDRGTFDTTPTLGYKGEFNWVDVWGPTYICPTMEHFGTVGDGGKWVCGVETMLQREGCIIYSFGSLADYSFEQEALARTKCEVHVFDPTVKPSAMREREKLLNGDGPKRVYWYSVGVSNVDDDSSTLLQCYGGNDLLYPPRQQGRRSMLAETGRKLLGGFNLPKLWRPPDEQQAIATVVTDQPETEEPPVTSSTTPAAKDQPVATPEVPATPVVSPRQAAVEETIQKLQEQRARINSTADSCGVSAHKPGGSTPPTKNEVTVGVTKDLTGAPHGDKRTKCRLATLPTLMKSLGHDWVDVVKMDIEGSEYATLGYIADLPGDAMRFTQLQLEMHLGWGVTPTQPQVEQFGTLLQLMSHGYRTTFLEPNIYFAPQTCHELAFLKMDDCGNVVTPLNA